MIREMFVDSPRYTGQELMDRLKFFIGIILALTLFGIVFVVLYSLIFVTQPLDAISPVDNKFFELIIPIATFLTGTLSGIMLASTPEAQEKALAAANKGWDKPPSPPSPPPKIDPVFNTSPAAFGDSTLGGNTMSTFTASPQVVTGFGGKPAPAPAPQPEI
jgi:hypothetical protein